MKPKEEGTQLTILTRFLGCREPALAEGALEDRDFVRRERHYALSLWFVVVKAKLSELKLGGAEQLRS
jgi:hypothetical protein